MESARFLPPLRLMRLLICEFVMPGAWWPVAGSRSLAGKSVVPLTRAYSGTLRLEIRRLTAVRMPEAASSARVCSFPWSSVHGDFWSAPATIAGRPVREIRRPRGVADTPVISASGTA